MSLDWLGDSVTLALGIGGFFLGGLNERGRDRRLSAREKTARDEAAKERRDSERHQFQLDNYLALQDALRDFVRACIAISFSDRKNIQDHGHFSQSLPGLSDAEIEARGTYLRLLNRVLDDKLREALRRLLNLAGDVITPPSNKSISQDDALAWIRDGLSRLTASVDEVNDMLGERLRTELRR
jgi:hypothetical protein